MNETTTGSTQFGGFWIRFLAMVIDGIIITIAFYFINSIFGFTGLMHSLATTTIFAVYYVMLIGSKWQATVGKRVFSLYVTTADGAALNKVSALIRFLAFYAPSIFMIVLAGGIVVDPQNPTAALSDLGLVGKIGFILTLIWYVPAGLTKEKTGVHDMICKTRVRRGRPS